MIVIDEKAAWKIFLMIQIKICNKNNELWKKKKKESIPLTNK